MSHSGFTGWHNPCLAFASSNPQTETHGRWPRGRRDITQMQADTNSEKLNYKHKYILWNKYNWLEDTNASRYKFYFNCFPFIDDAGPTAFKYFPQVKIPPRNDSTRKDKQTSGKIEQLKCPKKFFRTNHIAAGASHWKRDSVSFILTTVLSHECSFCSLSNPQENLSRRFPHGFFFYQNRTMSSLNCNSNYF